MKKFYSFLVVAVVAITVMFAATGGNEPIVKVWNFSEWEKVTYEETTTVDGLTIYVAASDKPVTIDGSKKTIEDVAYTQRLKYGGKTSWDGNLPTGRALSFDVEGASTIEVAMTSASNTGTGRFLTAYANNNETALGTFEAPVDGAIEVVKYEYTDEAPATIILGVDGGINIYFIRVTTVPAAGGDEFENISDLNALVDFESNTTVNIAADLTVAVVNDFVALLYDGASYCPMVQIPEGLDLKAGDVIKADWLAVYTNGALVPGSKLTVDGTAEVPAPAPYTAEDAIQVYHQNFYGTLVGVQFNEALAEAGTAYWGVNDVAPVPYVNFLGIEAAEGIYDVTGFFMDVNAIADIDDEPVIAFFVLDVVPTVETISNFTALADVENNTTIAIGTDATVVVANEALNLLYDGETYMGVKAQTELKAGDVVKAGWTAVYAEGLLNAAELTVEGTADVPAATPMSVDNYVNPMTNLWWYYDLNNVVVGETIDQYGTTYNNYLTGNGEHYVVLISDVLGIAPIEAGAYDIKGFFMPFEIEEDDVVPVFVPVAVAPATPVLPQIESLNALCDAPVGTDVEIACDVTVVVAGRINLVWDGESYYGLASDDQTFEAGDIIAAGWNATVDNFGLYAGAEVTVSGKAETLPTPAVVTAEDLAQAYSEWLYLDLQNVLVPEMEAGDFVAVEMGEQEFFMYDILNIADVESGFYNVTGFWMPNPNKGIAPLEEGEDEGTPGTGDGSAEDHMQVDSNDLVFVPVAFAAALPHIESLTALTDLNVGDEVVIACDLTVVVAGTINLVWDGETYYGLGVDDQELEAGDIIAAGWKAVVDNFGIYAAETVYVNGTTDTLPEAIEVDAENLQQAYSEWLYLNLQDVVIPMEMEAGDFLAVEMGDQEFFMYDILNLVEKVDAGHYNVTGFWMPNPNKGIAPLEEGEDEGTPGTGDGSAEDHMQVDSNDLVFVPVSFEKAGSGINAVESAEGEAVYYNINGVKVQNPQAGQTVIRVINGHATKIRK